MGYLYFLAGSPHEHSLLSNVNQRSLQVYQDLIAEGSPKSMATQGLVVLLKRTMEDYKDRFYEESFDAHPNKFYTVAQIDEYRQQGFSDTHLQDIAHVVCAEVFGHDVGVNVAIQDNDLGVIFTKLL